MAYTINYDSTGNDKFSAASRRRISRNGYISIICFVVILLVWCITPVRVAVLDFLLPGNGAVTRQAAGDMINALKQGQGIKEAFTDFCIEIIEHA